MLYFYTKLNNMRKLFTLLLLTFSMFTYSQKVTVNLDDLTLNKILTQKYNDCETARWQLEDSVDVLNQHIANLNTSIDVLKIKSQDCAKNQVDVLILLITNISTFVIFITLIILMHYKNKSDGVERL
jgi:hypothetical protein